MHENYPYPNIKKYKKKDRINWGRPNKGKKNNKKQVHVPLFCIIEQWGVFIPSFAKLKKINALPSCQHGYAFNQTPP